MHFQRAKTIQLVIKLACAQNIKETPTCVPVENRRKTYMRPMYDCGHKNPWTCTRCVTVDEKICTHLKSTHLLFLLASSPLLVQLSSLFDPQIWTRSQWGARQRPKGSLNGPLFTLKIRWIMNQIFSIKRGHRCSIFPRIYLYYYATSILLQGTSFLLGAY